MKKVYSKIYPKKLLHVFVKPSDLKNNITELTSHNSFLQCLGLKLLKGKKFNAHKHKKIKDPLKITKKNLNPKNKNTQNLNYTLQNHKYY